jgi:hypothetical protein
MKLIVIGLLGLKISEEVRPLLGHHLWNYSRDRIELRREMDDYTSINVSYTKGAGVKLPS